MHYVTLTSWQMWPIIHFNLTLTSPITHFQFWLSHPPNKQWLTTVLEGSGLSLYSDNLSIFSLFFFLREKMSEVMHVNEACTRRQSLTLPLLFTDAQHYVPNLTIYTHTRIFIHDSCAGSGWHCLTAQAYFSVWETSACLF